MILPLSLRPLLLIVGLAAGPVFAAQDGVEAPAESQTEAPGAAAPDEDVVAPPALPTSLDEAYAIDLSLLREGLMTLSAEEAAEHLAAWTTLAETAQERWDAAIAGPRDPSVSLPALGVGRDFLVQGGAISARAVTDLGGDASEANDILTAIRSEELERVDAAFTVPASEAVGREIPVEILKANLRPLTKAQVEVQLVGWVELVRAKCLAVRNVEVAVLQSDSEEEIEVFNSRAVELRAEREHLIDRTVAVIDALEEKGGDVAEARAYIDSVVQVPPITGWRAAMTTARAWSTSSDGGGALGLSALKAGITLVVAWFIAGLLARLARRAMRGIRSASDLLGNFVVVSVRRIGIALGLLVALAQLGVDMTPMLAAIGAAGLVIGLALQGTLSNFASGLLIMTNRPFDVGDLVETGGITGFVRGMTLLSTRIETIDSKTVYVPNNMVWTDTIMNYTASPHRRVDLVFGIAYEDDFKRAKAVLHDVVTAHEKVLADPEPTIRMHELGDSSVNFVVRPWALNEDYWDVYWDLTEAVKERFDAEGISIPFPQRDVHLIPAPSEGATSDEIRPASRPEKSVAQSS